MRLLEVTKTKIDSSIPWGGPDRVCFLPFEYDASNEIFKMTIPVQELIETTRKSDYRAKILKEEFLDFLKLYLVNLLEK